MNAAIIGLGLIGGSLAKAFKAKTEHTVYGGDCNAQVLLKAKLLQSIDFELTQEALPQMDLVILALYPQAVLDWLNENAARLHSGAVVLDTCGVKGAVCSEALALCRQHGVYFVGGHPMAGIARSGFDAAVENLFNQASMLIVPDPQIDIKVLEQLKEQLLQLGFGTVKVTTAEEHDRVIAYTSQLAHVVASAYIKSPTALRHPGFSAGSFRDMTRVATLQEEMWTELFLDNQPALLEEVQRFIDNMTDFRDALKARDAASLKTLLRAGREAKAAVDALPHEPWSPF